MSVHNLILSCIECERCGLLTGTYMGLALRLWFVHLVQCEGPRMNRTTSRWLRYWFTLAETVYTAMTDRIIISSQVIKVLLFNVSERRSYQRDRRCWVSACPWYGVIKAWGKFLLRICNTLVHPYPTIREHSRVHVRFPWSIRITSTWSLGHSCFIPGYCSLRCHNFFMWFPRALVWCAHQGLESLLTLSRYWPGIVTAGLLSL